MDSEISQTTDTTIYPVRFDVVGASFRKSELSERERLAAFGKDIDKVLPELRDVCKVNEAALISTCNRFEIVSVAAEAASGGSPQERVADYLRVSFGSKLNVDQLYLLKNDAAIRHIFRVTSSLDSMVLGEAQILGQVKEWYQKAAELGCAGKYLHHLFQFAFSLAKKVRSNTAVADRGISVSYVAVRLAQQIFGDLKNCSVLVIGSGAMAELAGLHLKARGCKNIIVANRTLERAFELARRLEGSAIALSDIEQQLSSVDVVISSVADLDKPLIEAASLRKINRSRALFLVDLGMPRNFSPLLGEIDNVYLYNIDDLGQIVDENRAVREEAAKEAELIIEHGIFRFEKWLTKVSAEPSILDFRARVLALCEEELREALGGKLGFEETEILERLSRRISQRMSHDITRTLARLPGGKLDREGLLRMLFDEYLKDL